MRDLAVLFLHILATLARLAGPGGASAVVTNAPVREVPPLLVDAAFGRFTFTNSYTTTEERTMSVTLVDCQRAIRRGCF
jgi:phosphoglycolate phosphatase-like HAD superfamily hydrolase